MSSNVSRNDGTPVNVTRHGTDPPTMREPTEDVGPKGRLRATADGPRHPELGPRHRALGRQTLPSCPLPSPGIGTGASGVQAIPSNGSTRGKCVENGKRRRLGCAPPRSNPSWTDENEIAEIAEESTEDNPSCSWTQRSLRKLKVPCRCPNGDAEGRACGRE